MKVIGWIATIIGLIIFAPFIIAVLAGALYVLGYLILIASVIGVVCFIGVCIMRAFSPDEPAGQVKPDTTIPTTARAVPLNLAPVPGWYDNPEDARTVRYWDGEVWTDQIKLKIYKRA